ncbi:MAG: heteromeric transposase endonuclease subunit TnsA [Desulfobulbaceae bacterium]|nr:heteromeric transposase endonuclease subunit TnsA [Desulfobulbaceae bacterium]
MSRTTARNDRNSKVNTPSSPRNDRSLIDRNWISRRINEGRGQGEGHTWRSWLEVRDVPSRGWSYRIQSWHCSGQCHHLLSRVELDYCMVLSWSPTVIGIRTQVPLIDIETTLDIADELGIRYPIIRHPHRQKQWMMPVLTSDFLVTVLQEGVPVDVIRTVKRSDDLLSRRTLEKLQIEQEYWRRQGKSWSIITDDTIPQALARNVWFVYCHRDRNETLTRCNITEEQLSAIHEVLLPKLQSGDVFNAAALFCDHTLGLRPGTSLAAAKYYIAAQLWPIDMYKVIDPGRPLMFQAVE